MKHTIIYTKEYLLVVDESKIKEGDYYLSKISDDIFRRAIGGHWIENYDKKMYHKVIAHLPLNNSPVLKGVDLLPPLLIKCYCGHTTYCDCAPLEQGDDVEKLARENASMCEDDWEDGYNKAKSKYKYTEDDLWKAYQTGMKLEGFKELIQSLSQPKMPTSFSPKMVCDQCNGDDITDSCYCHHGSYKIIPKTTTSSQGQTVWVGKYLYQQYAKL